MNVVKADSPLKHNYFAMWIRNPRSCYVTCSDFPPLGVLSVGPGHNHQRIEQEQKAGKEII